MTIDQLKGILNKDPFYFTKGVQIETTNRCNYATWHSRCPISRYKEKKILPMKKIVDILKELGRYNYKQAIYPFNYGEPLIDPRMFSIIEKARKLVPGAGIALYTNGFMVDETMIRDLNDIGLNRLNISVYTPEDEVYFHKLIVGVRKQIPMLLRAYGRYPMEEKMNDKLDWYDSDPSPLSRGCSAPYSYLLINSNGDLGLCCHDWKNTFTFGSLYKNKLVDLIKSQKAMEVFINLRNRKRDLYALCARCKKHR
jgi:2-deoxy-scyllo-inosamine dehydrogenase (SAM-dependent)